jgi:micrococcal nuclease
MAKQTSKKKKTSVRRKLAAVAAGVVLLVAGTVGVATRFANPGELVIKVVDGDSFFIADGQTIRLYGIDAPELGNCFSSESKEALTKLILNKKVVLKEPITDQYRRVMALVYVDDKLVNEYMMKNGFAVYQGEGGTQTEVLKKANEFAQKNKLGVFSEKCYQINPPNPSCNIKGNIKKEDGGKYYLMPSCGYYYQTIVQKSLGEQWFCTEAEAQKAGYTKSSNCK